jgi:hypothetical protein
MEQDDPSGDRYELKLTLAFRVTDYSALGRAGLDAALSQAEQPPEDYVAFLKSDPMHGIMDLVVQAIETGLPGIEIEGLAGGMNDLPEEYSDDWPYDWPPENPPWPDAENLPDEDDRTHRPWPEAEDLPDEDDH